MPNSLLITYCATIFIASMIPGPSSLLALNQGARFGLTSGAMGGLGNVCASLTQAAISFLLILQIRHLSATLLLALKYIGAAYIIYLGISLFKVKHFGVAEADDLNPDYQGVDQLKNFRDGFVFAIANPKALTFFGALFPQFVKASDTHALHIAAVFAPIAIIAYVCFLAYVFAGTSLVRTLNKTDRIGAYMGSAIVISGIALLFT